MKPSRQWKLSSVRKLLVAAIFLLAGPTVFAQSADVGLVSMAAGDARFVPLGGRAAEVRAFMKIRDGDRFNLPAGAQVRLVYYESARQELWAGPASFRAGKGASEEISGKPAEVGTLPVAAKLRIARVPELMQNAKLGGIQVRGALPRAPKAGPEQQATLREARETYESMRSNSAADDITPELVLYAALYDLRLFDDMNVVVDAMLRKQPGNDDLRQLRARVETRGAR